LSISALIPTYNRKLQVFRAIDSVLAQTLPVNEIIVVDDGSTDGTSEAIRAHYGSRVTVIRQENRGVSAARNRAVNEARCEWVAFLDNDDVWLPTKLKRQMEALTTLGSEFGACFTNCNYFGNPDLDSTAFEEAELKINSESGPLCNPIKHIVGANGSYVHCLCVSSLVVLRSTVKETGGFDETLGFSEDRDLIFRLSFKTEFCVISTPLVSIDRLPDLPRLTGLLAHMSDETYAWREFILKKMLAHSEFTDRDMRQSLKDELIALYYGGAAERISHLRLMAALQSIYKIRHMGQTYWEIICALLARAGKKLSRTLGQQLSES